MPLAVGAAADERAVRRAARMRMHLPYTSSAYSSKAGPSGGQGTIVKARPQQYIKSDVPVDGWSFNAVMWSLMCASVSRP